MDKIKSFNDKKLPTIYSSNINHLKSISPEVKSNISNSFNYSIFSKKVKNSNSSYYNEKKNIIDNKFDKQQNYIPYLKIAINNKDEINSDKNHILTQYNNNNIILQKQNLDGLLERLKQKSKKIQNSILSNRILNISKNNNLFNDSYYNYIYNLKVKKEESLKKNDDKKEKTTEYNYDLKPSSTNSSFKLKTDISDSNPINLEKINLIKPIEDKLSASATQNKLKIQNKTINNNSQFPKFYSSNRNNVFGISNNFNNSRSSSLSNKRLCPLCHNEVDYYRYRSHLNMHPSQIFNWLYLGSYRNACDVRDLQNLKINYILNCAIECENKNLPSDINVFHAKINDYPYFQISSYFEKTNSFINKAKLSGGSILIHCQLGISRSTTCLIAYMIKYLGYTTLSALQHIKRKRPQVMPNFGFIHQLKNYENKLKIGDSKNKSDDGDLGDKKPGKTEENLELYFNQNIF